MKGMMKVTNFGAVCTLAIALGGCGGGGGGGVASTPAPTPTPVASNTSLQNLTNSQSFSNDAVLGQASYPTTGASGTVTPSANVALTVSYNASTQTYSLTH